MTDSIKQVSGKYGTTNLSLIANALGTVITDVATVLPILKAPSFWGKLKAGSQLVDAVTALIPLVALDVAALVNEIRDLDDMDKEAVCVTFNLATTLQTKATENVIEAVFKSVVTGTDFVGDMLNIFKPAVVQLAVQSEKTA